MSGVIAVLAFGYVAFGAILSIIFGEVVEPLELNREERHGVHVLLSMLWPLTLVVFAVYAVARAVVGFVAAMRGLVVLLRRLRRGIPAAKTVIR